METEVSSVNYPVLPFQCSFLDQESNPYAENADIFYKQIIKNCLAQPYELRSNLIPPRAYPTNYVCTFNLNLNLDPLRIINDPVNIDFKALTAAMPYIGYNPSRFAAAVLRINLPDTSIKGTVLMFTSGKMVCTGTTSYHLSLLVSNYAVSMISKYSGMPELEKASIRDFTTQNVAASAYAGFFIALQPLSDHWSLQVNYEPTLFPGLIFRIPILQLYYTQTASLHIEDLTEGATSQEEANAIIAKRENDFLVFLVFRSGSVVITGAKREEETASGWHWFYRNVLCEFQDKDCNILHSSEYRHATAPLDSEAHDVLDRVDALVQSIDTRAYDLMPDFNVSELHQIVGTAQDLPYNMDAVNTSVLDWFSTYAS